MITLLGCGAAAAYVFTAQKQYSATSALLFRDDSVPNAVGALLDGSASATAPSADPALLQATDVHLVELRTVADATAAALRNHLTGGEVAHDVSIGSTSGSTSANVVTITATTPHPTLSAAIANTYAEQFVKFRQQIDSSSILAARSQALRLLAQLPPSQSNGSLAQTLQSRAETLSLMASLQSGNAEVVQSANVPHAPSSPKKFEDLAIGLVIGLFWGILLALLAERFDRRIRTSEEIEAIVRRPILGIIPRSPAFARESPPKPTVVDLEAFRLLRANLTHLDAGGAAHTVVLVTSAQPGDGKSTVSTFLAGAVAAAGSRVLLIDADLRRSGRHVRALGLTQVLAGKADLPSAITSVAAPASVPNSATTMDVLPSGPLRADPSVLADDAFANVISWCESQYDMVIVDAPPLTLASEAVVLAQYASGVLVVARDAKTERILLRRLVDRLGLIRATVLGVVINDVVRLPGYGYSYGYYAASPATESASPEAPLGSFNGSPALDTSESRDHRPRAAQS